MYDILHIHSDTTISMKAKDKKHNKSAWYTADTIHYYSLYIIANAATLVTFLATKTSNL